MILTGHARTHTHASEIPISLQQITQHALSSQLRAQNPSPSLGPREPVIYRSIYPPTLTQHSTFGISLFPIVFFPPHTRWRAYALISLSGSPETGPISCPTRQPYRVLRLGLLPAGQMITIFSSKTRVDRVSNLDVDSAYTLVFCLFVFILLFLWFSVTLLLLLLGARIMWLNV